MTDEPVNILGHVERDLLNGLGVADILRKLLILGGRVSSPELRDWVSLELRGYPGTESLPAYRVVPALVQIDAIVGLTQISHQTISLSLLPEEIQDDIGRGMPLGRGIGEIEALIAGRSGDDTLQFSLPAGPELALFIDRRANKPGQTITSIYWALSCSALAGVIDQVKTRLAELVAELRAATPSDDVLPTREATAAAVNIVVRGFGSRVNVVSAQAGPGATATITSSPGDSESASPFWTVGKRIGAVCAGVAATGASVVAILQFWSP